MNLIWNEKSICNVIYATNLNQVQRNFPFVTLFLVSYTNTCKWHKFFATAARLVSKHGQRRTGYLYATFCPYDFLIMSTVPFPSYDELAMQMQFELRQSTHLRCLRVIATSSLSPSKLTQLCVGERFVAARWAGNSIESVMRIIHDSTKLDNFEGKKFSFDETHTQNRLIFSERIKLLYISLATIARSKLREK